MRSHTRQHMHMHIRMHTYAFTQTRMHARKKKVDMDEVVADAGFTTTHCFTRFHIERKSEYYINQVVPLLMATLARWLS